MEKNTPPSIGKKNNRLEDCFGLIHQALFEKRLSDAVRLFLAGQDRGHIPRSKKLIDWLREKDSLFIRRIIAAFAHHPCPFCKNGLLTCEFCEGKGDIDSTRICETCLGLGLMLCNFCGGTGWSPIQSVPKGMRIAVLLERAHVALSHLGDLSRRPILAKGQQLTGSDFKKAAFLLLGFNRYISALEAVLVAGDNYTSYVENTDKLRDKMPDCSQGALLAGRRMYRLIRLMADSSRRLSQQATQNPKKALLFSLRAAFYQSMVDKNLPVEQTGIGHPLMIRAIKHLREKSQSKK
jgi:hypothetical protein